MKKSLVARGILGSLSLCGVLGLVGCGAEVGDGAAGDSAEIGSTSQALTVNGNANKSVQFYGAVKLDSSIQNSAGHVDTLELVVGGMSASGTLSTQISVFDTEADSLTQLRNAANNADIVLPTALVEPIVAQIPGETLAYLITSGRTARDGAPNADSYILKLTLSSSKIASATITTVASPNGTPLPSGRVFNFKGVKQCGSSANKKLIAFGGVTSSSGFQSLTSLSATTDIMVFTYDATTPANSDWTQLKDGSSNDVKLRTSRGYPEVLDVDATNHDEFFIAGGLQAGAIALSSVDRLVVNSSCVAQNASNDGGIFKVAEAAPMPEARARFTSEANTATVLDFPEEDTDTEFDFIVGGGNNTGSYVNGTALPTATYQFDPDGTTAGKQGQWRSAGAIREGRVFPRMIKYSSTVAKMVTGIMPQSGSENTNRYYQSSLVVDRFTSGAWDANGGTDLSDDRVGVFADLLNDGAGNFKGYISLGAKHTTTTGASAVNATSTPGTTLTPLP